MQLLYLPENMLRTLRFRSRGKKNRTSVYGALWFHFPAVHNPQVSRLAIIGELV